MSAAGLVLDDVVVRRGSFEIATSLSVAPGEILALVGPNGRGKSTLLDAVAGLLPLAAGRIALAGSVLAQGAAPAVFIAPQHRGVGLVPQRHVLFGHLTALENAAFGPRSRGVRRTEARNLGGAWLERFGVGELASRRADRLSGGQSQRVALARALASEPRALLLDEPFAAVDAGGRADLGALVRSAVAEARIPCVLVSHDSGEVDRLADRIHPLP